MAQEQQPINKHRSMRNYFWDGNKIPLHEFLAEQREAEIRQSLNNGHNLKQPVHARTKIID